VAPDWRAKMSDRWEAVPTLTDEELKIFLREEGVPEEELEKELIKLKINANVSSQVRAVLITPEVDKTLKALVSFAETHIFDSVNNEKLVELKEALWPK
jgi:hypothetical protein